MLKLNTRISFVTINECFSCSSIYFISFLNPVRILLLFNTFYNWEKREEELSTTQSHITQSHSTLTLSTLLRHISSSPLSCHNPCHYDCWLVASWAWHLHHYRRHHHHQQKRWCSCNHKTLSTTIQKPKILLHVTNSNTKPLNWNKSPWRSVDYPCPRLKGTYQLLVWHTQSCAAEWCLLCVRVFMRVCPLSFQPPLSTTITRQSCVAIIRSCVRIKSCLRTAAAGTVTKTVLQWLADLPACRP